MNRTFSLTKLLAVAVMAVFMAALPLRAYAADVIKHIKVEGTERIEPATVLSYISVQAGDPFDTSRLNGALKSLYATGLFADVSLYQEGDDLIIKVAENPIINQIAFEGNKKFKDEDLLSEIQLRPRNVLARTKVQADVERLQEIYRASGRFSVDIDPQIIKLDQNRVNLVFEINEGPQTLISRISFIGNHHYDDADLRKVIRSQEERWWRFWSSDDKYNPDRLAYDRELLRKFYLNHGYADFRIDNAVAELSPDRKSFFVTFTLEEGERYRVGKVHIQSNMKDVNADNYRKDVTFKPGDWYSANEIENSVDKLTDALNSHRHPFVDVRPDVQRNTATRTIDVLFNLNEGQKVFVNNINISGNVRTLDEVIRREMTLSEGDPFNAAKLKKSEQKLNDLGFFEKVKVKPVPAAEPGKEDIDINVQEKSTGALSLGGGFSTTDGPLADFSISEKNFLGKGQNVNLSTTIAARRTQYSLSFTEPYFLKRDLSAGIDLFHTTTDYQSESSFDTKETGFGLRLGYPLSDHWRQNLSYRYDDEDITNVPSDASIYIQQQTGRRTTSSIGQRLTYDTTDSKTDPTQGFLGRLDTELAGLGGDARYYKARLGGTYFYPIADNWILSVLGEGGYVHGYGGETVHINERFYIGGDTLRGFKDSGIGPRDQATGDALGGNQFYRGSVQLDFPSGLPEDLGVRLHTFSDFGSLWTLDSTGTGIQDDSAIRVSAGVGVSWKSPMGLVRADFAAPVKKENYDKRQIFRFSFGTRF